MAVSAGSFVPQISFSYIWFVLKFQPCYMLLAADW